MPAESSRRPDAARSACRHSSLPCSAPTVPCSSGNARSHASSGMREAGCSPAPPGSRSTRTPTTTSGSGCSKTPGCARPGYTPPGTPPRPSCWPYASPRQLSLMGWSSASMAARYQHVTDAMRSQVAGQVGGLIWQAAPGPGQATAMLLVRRDSLAVVLAAAEQCVTRHGVDAGQAAVLMAALADLRAPWPTWPESPGTSNEPKLSQGGRRKNDRRQRISRRRRSAWRRMRDSNSRGLAPNTLSKRAP